MKLLNVRVSNDDRPLYLRLAESVRRSIQAGKVKPGDALPSTRDLALTTGAHRHTVMAALDELVAEGWLDARERRGYHVSTSLPADPLQSPRALALSAASDAHDFRIVRDVSAESLLADRPVRHNFQSGLPDLRCFPHAELRSHIAQALRRSGPSLLGFGDPAGHPPFIEELETYLRRVRGIDRREVVVTHGSQEGIFITAQLLVAPGDKVAVEVPGYQPTWRALRAAGAELLPVPVDGEGLDPDAFANLAARKKIRLLYMTPLHQYPTTVTLPAARRLRVYESAVKYGVPILEDDYDHEFHYRCQPLAPLASQDPAGIVVHVATFSKVLYPSARLGFMAIPKQLAAAAREYRRLMTRQNDAVLQEAVARWMRDGGFERHLRRMRRLYEERRDTVVACLEEAREQGHKLDWHTPDGGMAVWINTFTDSSALAKRAAARSIHVMPEHQFHLRPSKGTHIRLGFANQTPAELRAGLRELLQEL